MRKFFYWMLTMTLLFASLGPSLSIVMAESVEGISSESLEENETELDVTSETVSSIESDESLENGLSEVNSEPAVSEELDEQVDGAEKIISPEYLVLELIGAVDDNTLVIRGVAGPGVVVELKNQSDQVLQTVVSESNGDFVFKLNEPFDAKTGLEIETYKESELLSELSFNVEGRGLHYEAVSEKSTEIIGSTSSDKIVILLNAEGEILDEVQSDADGGFHFNLVEPLVRDTVLFLQVKDDERVAREENLKVIETVNEVKKLDEENTLQSLALFPSLVTVGTVRDGIIVDDVPITDTTENIAGYVTADAGLIDIDLGLLGSLLGLVTDILTDLSGKKITLTITDSSGGFYSDYTDLSNSNDLSFSFDIPQGVLIPGDSQLTLSVEALVLRLGLIKINFKDLKLPVVGNRLELSTVPNDMKFNTTELEYSPGKKITRQQTEPLTIEVLDTISLSNPAEHEWKVKVHATEPLTINGNDGVDHLLGGSLFFNNQMIEGPEKSQIVGAKGDFTHTGNGAYSYTIPAEDDFYLQFNPALDAIEGSYTTTIQWELVNGP